MTVRLVIATPVYGSVSTGFVSLAYHSAILALSRDTGIEIQEAYTNMDLCRARARAVEHFLLHDTAEHLLFWDCDVGGSGPRVAKIIRAMIAANKDIVCAPYPMKREPPTLPVKPLDPPHCEGDLVECEAVPMGFTLISRAAAATMREAYAHELAFRDMLPDGPVETVSLFHLKFAETAQSERVLLSEDYSFCWRARWIGFRVWAFMGDGAPLDHVGGHVYRGQV
jgi:hypothetical protein